MRLALALATLDSGGPSRATWLACMDFRSTVAEAVREAIQAPEEGVRRSVARIADSFEVVLTTTTPGARATDEMIADLVQVKGAAPRCAWRVAGAV